MVRVLILKSGGARTDTPIHRAILPAQIGVSAYRRICLLDRRIGVSAYLLLDRRIGVFPARIGVSAYRRIGVFPARIGVSAYRRIGVCAPSGPCAGVSAYRRIGARRFCDTICRHAARLRKQKHEQTGKSFSSPLTTVSPSIMYCTGFFCYRIYLATCEPGPAPHALQLV